ncbi:hypothetical protein [Candidatus Mycobacterium methanotrophicum]|uniref:Uncharacterized protein n=1 Tax=Candidatus Mycobacterium methanotrophicum TaxID=2943498 RepID=A0ABY4QLG5_9MYCO|nr:hypothetical protein [Candidatus Mycobacterium methanotrophicum]UQX11833.1 hypothetical protein M5I08_05295 [Candidatus Mycobacterium methanotrophicum]
MTNPKTQVNKKITRVNKMPLDKPSSWDVYLDTANKWGINKLHALRQLFTTGAWLPPMLVPS